MVTEIYRTVLQQARDMGKSNPCEFDLDQLIDKNSEHLSTSDIRRAYTIFMKEKLKPHKPLSASDLLKSAYGVERSYRAASNEIYDPINVLKKCSARFANNVTKRAKYLGALDTLDTAYEWADLRQVTNKEIFEKVREGKTYLRGAGIVNNAKYALKTIPLCIPLAHRKFNMKAPLMRFMLALEDCLKDKILSADS